MCPAPGPGPWPPEGCGGGELPGRCQRGWTEPDQRQVATESWLGGLRGEEGRHLWERGHGEAVGGVCVCTWTCAEGRHLHSVTIMVIGKHLGFIMRPCGRDQGARNPGVHRFQPKAEWLESCPPSFCWSVCTSLPPALCFSYKDVSVAPLGAYVGVGRDGDRPSGFPVCRVQHVGSSCSVVPTQTRRGREE